MSQSITYRASVYSRELTYENLKGEVKTVELFFALSPIDLMSVLASVPSNRSRSNDPRKRGQEQGMTDAQQIKIVQDLAAKAAGFISDDGETFEPYETFVNDIAGQAFLTKLTSSDADRKEFAEKVILDPFRSYVEFARADESNTPKAIKELEGYLVDLEKAFAIEPEPEETLEERRARIQAELAALEQN